MNPAKFILRITAFCLVFLPVMLIWTYLFKNVPEPITITQYISIVLLEIITGLGGLVIGLILVDKYLEVVEKII